MQLSDKPAKLSIPFANSGTRTAIPTPSQIGITAGAASLTDGFPPLTRTPIAAGGVPPSGADMNGILYEMSAVDRWANAGGGYPYDSTYATAIGGYPKGARVLRTDGIGYWLNTTDNNATDPEAGGAGWVPDLMPGSTPVTMTGSNVTLTPLQYGQPVIRITGLLTANLNLIFPALAAGWTVINATTGAFTITAKTAAGTGVTVSGAMAIVGDGTNILSAASYSRIKASANVTLYVATTGNDSNSGLAAGTPFATIQKAYDTFRGSYDMSGFVATIQLADGTYTAGLSLAQTLIGQPGAGGLILNGNAGTPSNVVISTTNADCVSVSTGASITIQNVKLQTTTSGSGILVANNGFVLIGTGTVFGACATAHINNSSGQCGGTGNYSIVGSAPVHWKTGDGATTVINGQTITITGTPAFSAAFAQSYNTSILNVGANTFSGSATGSRYSASMSGVINVNGGGASYLPGNAVGTVATGGQYA